MKKILAYSILATLFAIASCKKDNNNSITGVNTKGVYVINQGNFNFGNAEISFYNPVTQKVTNNLFNGVNNYRLGDVAQSMYIKDTLGFIVVNNSQKVEVVKIPSLLHVRTITIPNSSPRYFLPVNDSIAYVSELYKNGVHVINYRAGTLVTNITGVASWTEQMILIGTDVVVEEQNLSDTTIASLSVINTLNNTFVKRYSYPGGNTAGIALDNQNRIWMATDEDSAQAITASLYCLNSDMSVNKRLSFPTGHHPNSLCIDGTASQLYFFDTGIYTLFIGATSVPTTTFAPGGGRNFYALGVDPVSGDVYAADALDFVQPSNIYRYAQSGGLIQSFTAGIITGNFAFNE